MRRLFFLLMGCIMLFISCGDNSNGNIKIGHEDIVINKEHDQGGKEKIDPKVDRKTGRKRDTINSVTKKITKLIEMLDSFTVRGDRIKYKEMNIRDSLIFSFIDLIQSDEQPIDIDVLKSLMSQIDSLDKVYIKLSSQIPENEFREYDDSLYTMHTSFLKRIKRERKERFSGFKSWERGTAHLRK